MRNLFLATALAVLSACQVHDGNVIHYDEGGRVDHYEVKAQTPHRIAGTCYSACTMYLRTGCVEPGARLVFHKPTTSVKTDWAESYWAERIAVSYPPAIAAWYLSDYRTTRTRSGAWAISRGAIQCQ